jgi:hypothetical protein
MIGREADTRGLVEADLTDDEDTPLPITASVIVSELEPEVALAVESSPPEAVVSGEAACEPPACGTSACKTCGSGLDGPALVAPAVKVTSAAETAPALDAPAADTAIAPTTASKVAAITEKCTADAAAATDQDSVVCPPTCPTVTA